MARAPAPLFFSLSPPFPSYNAHIRYEGTSQYTTAVTKVKVLCQGQGRMSRLHFSKNFVGIIVHKHILFLLQLASEVALPEDDDDQL